MAHKKKRRFTQIMEDESYSVIYNKLPKEWVLHQYAPDYGIDFVVETFKFNADKTEAETLGELFFVQLKSVQKTKNITKKVYSRGNVEKTTDIDQDEYIEIDAITFSLDVSELLTVEAMGQAVPVLLIVVDLYSSEAYFLCLNDYIEKVLLPDSPDYYKQDTKTLYIPISNKINKNSYANLMFYARRSKLYGAFNKFSYQKNELNYSSYDINKIKRFLEIIMRYDFWNLEPQWPALTMCYNDIKYLHELIYESVENQNKMISERFNIDIGNNDREEFIFKMIVLPTWDRLVNMGCIYEEICKEWHLPTFLACAVLK